MSAAASAAPRIISPPIRPAEVLYLLFAPIAAIWLLGISLIDQHGFVDPEFYTGYGQSFGRMMQVFPLTYYAARFPVMFLNLTSQSLWPGMAGYIAVRAIVFGASAVPLYLLARRFYGLAPAVVAYAFLFLNPLFPRILCWDLTTFLSIPMGLAGISLWLVAERSASWPVFVAGFAFAVSVNSHIFTGTAIGIFLGVEFLFAVRRRGLSTFAVACIIALAGALTCFGLGLLFYSATVGFVSPLRLWQVTFGAIVAGQQYANTNFVPLGSYYATNYEMYAPVVTITVALALNGRSLLADTIDARLTWFASAYLAAYCLAVFALHMNVVQYFWYFGHLTIAVYLVVPLIVARAQSRLSAAPVLFTVTLTGIALLVTFRLATAAHAVRWAAGNGEVVATILTAGALAAVLLRSDRRWAIASGIVILAVVLQTVYLSASHLSVYDRSANKVEVPLFDAIRDYHALLRQYDRVGHRVRTWYPTQDSQLVSLASSNLLYTLQNPWTGPGMPTVSRAELSNIDAATGYIVVVSPDAAQIEEGLRALTAENVHYSRVLQQRWGRPPAQFTATLVEMVR